MMKKTILLSLIMITLWGCTTFSRYYTSGNEALMNKDWDTAIDYYERAALQNPTNSVYRLALVRAKLSASQAYLAQARSLAHREQKEEAVAAYEKALSYDPDNMSILQELRRFTAGPEVEEEPEIKPLEPPIKLQVSKDKIVLKFNQEVSLRSIFKALGKYSGVNMIFDESFRDKPFSIDMTDMDFERAVDTLCLATKNFYRILDEKTILVIADLPQNRIKFELVGVKTFFLSNINAQEVQQFIVQQVRSQTKIPTVTVDKDLNSITIRDTPAKLELAEKLIRRWDKPKGEVVLDIEIMEISRQKLKKIGLDLSDRTIGLSYSGGATEAGSGYNLSGLDFGKTENYQISIPSAFLDFLETDADSKLIAQPRLRGMHGQKIEYMVGDEVPIPQTTYNPIAAGGVPTQPITSFQYKDVGIEVYITPQIHIENDVTLEVELNVKSLGGTGYGDLPIISSRKIKNVMRLKDGETNLLVGLLKDEERKTLKGIAGIKSIPLLGTLFSNTDQTIQQTDVVLTITPHIIRNIIISDQEQNPLWIPLRDNTAGRGRAIAREEFSYPGREEGEPAARRNPRASRVTLNPPRFEGPRNRRFRINVNINSQEEIQNMSLSISYDAQVLKLEKVDRGNVIQRLGENPSFLEHIDNASGTCTVGFTNSKIGSGFKGSGRVVTLVFQPISPGETEIQILNVSANSPAGQSVTLETSPSRVRIR